MHAHVRSTHTCSCLWRVSVGAAVHSVDASEKEVKGAGCVKRVPSHMQLSMLGSVTGGVPLTRVTQEPSSTQ